MNDTDLVALLTLHLDVTAEELTLDSPYDELASALVSGTLLDDERERAIVLLAEQPAIRALLSAADEEPMLASPLPDARRPAVRLGWLPAAAAVVLLGFLVWQIVGEPAGTSPLERQVAMLERSAPSVFRGFRPLDASERRNLPSQVQRGGIDLVAPRGALRTGRPTLRWRATSVGGRYRVRVRAADGAIALERTVEGTELAWPEGVAPLSAGGRYVCRVEALDQSAVLIGAKAFRRLSDAEQRRYEDGLAHIRATQTTEAPLIAAHWAIRFELYAEADAHLARAPESAVAAETAAWLRATMGE